MSPTNILAFLAGGDRRSIGQSDLVAATVAANPELFDDLIRGLWCDDPLVRMRAADATEKVTRRLPALLLPWKDALLPLMAETEQPELRWHLAVMIPRLRLTASERRFVVPVLTRYLETTSSLVRTYALQGLADIAKTDPALRPTALDLIHDATQTGSPAMKARARKLILLLERR